MILKRSFAVFGRRMVVASGRLRLVRGWFMVASTLLDFVVLVALC